MTNYPQASPTVHNLAAYIVQSLGRTETMKLQKLLYYCNGWSLGLLDRPLFDDRIEAWKHGPVIKSIYPFHRTQSSVATWEWGRPADLTPVEKKVADAVLAAYGAKSGWALRNLTHGESPWLDAWEASGNGAIMGYEIRQDEIHQFFKTMADQGKQRAAAKKRASQV